MVESHWPSNWNGRSGFGPRVRTRNNYIRKTLSFTRRVKNHRKSLCKYGGIGYCRY
jgi:hypothetical protein